MKFLKKIYWIILCLLYCTVNQALGQDFYLAYDAFDQDSGVPLHSASGGSGWSGNWSVQNESLQGYVFSSTGLTYQSLQTIGRGISGGDVYLTAGRNLDIAESGPFNAYVENDDAIGSSVGTTLWVSGLLQKTQDNGQHVYFDLHNSNINWCNNCSSDNRLGIGYFGEDSEIGGEKRWSIRVGNEVFPSSVALIPGEAAFLVVKIDFRANETEFSLYVNPAELGYSGPPSHPELAFISPSQLRIRAVAAYMGDVEQNGQMDELRIGTSYPIVAPDESVDIILPPTADFTITPESGIAPLPVQVDAGASSDPNGSMLEYSWNWGDGSPLSTGVTSNHTYGMDVIGLVNVTLSVTNSYGLKAITSKVVKVLNAGNTFPCQTSVTMLNEATCGQNDGRIRINNGLATDWDISFRNNEGDEIAPTNGNEYHNLAKGNYFVTITGSNGCLDTYQLSMTTDSTTCSGWNAALCSMEMGVNVTGIADWNNENSFINLAKQVRSGIVTFHAGCECWDSNVEDQLAIDNDGYPLSIPQATSASSSTMVRYVLSSGNANLRANNYYVFLYDGVAEFTINSVETIEKTPGRVYFKVPAESGNIWLDVTYSQAGDYMRNFRLLRAEHEFINLDENIFNPVFLSRLSPFSTIRFMDWGAINNSPVVSWSDRAHINDRSYGSSKGVPFESMISLANKLNKNVWICVPHQADDDFVMQMATMFRDNLQSGLTIYLEYSNEVWNWIFGQAHYNNENKPENLNYGRAYAEKAKRIFAIWHSVFAGQTGRVKRVLGIQGGFNYLNEQILSQIPSDQWDLASPTYYFGLDHSSSGNPVLHGGSTGEDVNMNARNAYFGANGATGFRDIVQQDYRNIKVFGKGIVSYEGGQHYTDFNVPPYIQAMYDAQYLNSMYTLYDDVLNDIRSHGNRLAMAFVLSGTQESIYGSWGHLSDIYMQPPYLNAAPKYQACLDNSCLDFIPESEFPLAVGELSHFSAIYDGKESVQLVWIADAINENQTYQLQRKQEGTDFKTIYTKSINPLTKPMVFRYWDEQLSEGLYYYRLMISDDQGRIKYSDILPIKVGREEMLQIFPNPSSGRFFIHHNESKVKDMATITDLSGKRLRTYIMLPQNIDISDLPSGTYILSYKGKTYRLGKN